MCASLKIHGEWELILYDLVSFGHWIDHFLCPTMRSDLSCRSPPQEHIIQFCSLFRFRISRRAKLIIHFHSMTVGFICICDVYEITFANCFQIVLKRRVTNVIISLDGYIALLL